MHDRRGHRPEPTSGPENASGYLEQPGDQDHHRQEGQAVPLDELEDDDGQTGRRAAHRERRALDGTDQQTTDDPGHQAECRRHPRCKSNPEAQGKGDEEHDNRGERVCSQSAPACGAIHDRLAAPAATPASGRGTKAAGHEPRRAGGNSHHALAGGAGCPDSVDLEEFDVPSISTDREAWADAGGVKPRWRNRGEGRRPAGPASAESRRVSPVAVREQPRGG